MESLRIWPPEDDFDHPDWPLLEFLTSWARSSRASPPFGRSCLPSRPFILAAMRLSPRASLFLGLILTSAPALLLSQTASSAAPASGEPAAQQAQPPASGGEATGAPHPPQFDEQHRPITAGGFVPSGPVIFEDVSERPASPIGPTRWGQKEEKIHHRNQRLGSLPHRLRQRRMARHLRGQRLDLRCPGR